MRRRLLITCGTLLVRVPLLWIIFALLGFTWTFWFAGEYPTRYALGVLGLTSVIGLVTFIPGLDIISSAKNSKQPTTDL